MADEATIVLELTPREASAIYDFVLTVNWEHGSYGVEMKAIYEALTGVGSAFRQNEPTLRLTKTNEYLDINDIYLDE